MRRHRAGIAIAVLALLAGSGAKVTRSRESEGLLTQKNISLAMAEAITQAAFTACRADGSHVGISVLNRSGALKTFADDDGTNLVTFEVSRRKAYTALLYGTTSAEVGKMYAAPRTNSVAPPLDGIYPLGGGVAIKAGDEVIGAVGVAGANGGSPKDEACAKAGIGAVADQLK
jgi:uncharacterized protein GlcG (DUF336 family)